MLRCYLMDPDTDVCQTEQPQISYSVDFTAEQSSAMGSPNLLDRDPWQSMAIPLPHLGGPVGIPVDIK